MDTGAQGNTLPLRTYKQIFPDDIDIDGKPKNVYPKPPGLTLQMYNKTKLDCLGYVIFTCKYKDSDWIQSKFFIVDIDQPAICGLELSRELKLVTINVDNIDTMETNNLVIKNTEDLKQYSLTA